MKKLFVVLTVLAFSVSLISCKKEDVIQNEKGLVKQQKNGGGIDEALLNNILNQVDFDFASYVDGEDVEKEYTVIYGGQSYGMLITNAASKLDAWITTEAAIENETGSFVVQGLLVGLSHEHKCNHSVLMTDEERTCLIANGESMPIDDFKFHAVEIITSKVGQFLVTTVENGNVYFAGISATGNQTLWYNRLYEHFINHHSIKVDPDMPRLDGCTAWTNIFDEESIEIYNNIYLLLVAMGLDIVTDCEIDDDGIVWIKACNGTCVC